jgi:hypothetical protein
MAGLIVASVIGGRLVSALGRYKALSVLGLGLAIAGFIAIAAAVRAAAPLQFDFRYSNRIKLGVDDTERTRRAIKGAGGKRLTRACRTFMAYGIEWESITHLRRARVSR